MHLRASDNSGTPPSDSPPASHPGTHPPPEQKAHSARRLGPPALIRLATPASLSTPTFANCSRGFQACVQSQRGNSIRAPQSTSRGTSATATGGVGVGPSAPTGPTGGQVVAGRRGCGFCWAAAATHSPVPQARDLIGRGLTVEIGRIVFFRTVLPVQCDTYTAITAQTPSNPARD